jgi:hypothetical protein
MIGAHPEVMAMSYTRTKTLKNGSVRHYAVYLGADGRYHEEGGYKTDKEAAKIAAQRELEAARGDWASPMAGRTTFADYVSTYYWPTTEYLEVSTRTAYRYYLDMHFIPRFGKLPMRRISPAMIQAWVNDATRDGLSARSAVKYHALLHKIFARAVVDRVIPVNPASHTALPKVVRMPKQIITAKQFEAILANVPPRYRMMVLLAIETGLRWGELIALRPCDIDFTTHTVHVRRTIGEVAKKHSPTASAVSSRTTRKTMSSGTSRSTGQPADFSANTSRSTKFMTLSGCSHRKRARRCHGTTSAPSSGRRR